MAKYSKLKRIYIQQNLATSEIIEITGEKLSHLKNVLRLQAGKQFRIFNEQDGEYFAEIIEITRRNIRCKITNQFRKPQKFEGPILALGVIKQDKFIDAVRAAIQLGVVEIWPVMMENSQNIALNKARIEKCINETCEQCESMIIPTLKDTVNLEQLLSNMSESWLYFADEQADNMQNSTIGSKGNDMSQVILIGPEGGFSDEERERLLQLNNITRMSLGDNVLRAEIAAIAAISVVQHLNKAK